MSFTHMNSNRDLWTVIGALLVTFAALVWRPKRKVEVPHADDAASDVAPAPGPRS